MKTKLLRKIRRRYSWFFEEIFNDDKHGRLGHWVIIDRKKKTVTTTSEATPYMCRKVLNDGLYRRLRSLNTYHRAMRRISPNKQ